MKTKLVRKAKQAASALLVTLVICSILSLTVMYYLSLIDQQNYLGARSQTWNIAIAVSEAGVEDGMAQLNLNWPTLNTDNWTYDATTSSYTRSNSLPDGNSYTATIIVTNYSKPTIVARAYVQMPPRYAKLDPKNYTFLALAPGGGGTTTTTAPATDNRVTRAVAVTTAKNGLYLAALVARRNIDLNGNGITTDSYDSTDPTKSTNRTYDANKYKGDRGDIASDLNVVDSLSIGNANIYGHAHTGPGSPPDAIAYLPNCIVASHAWASANGNHGIQPGWYLQDANYTFPNTDLPDTSTYLQPSSGTASLLVGTMTTNSTGFAGYTNLGSPVWKSVFTSGQKVGQAYYYAILTSYDTQTYDQILTGPGNYIVGSANKVLVLGTNVNLVVTNGLGGSESFRIYNDAWHTNSATPLYPRSAVTVYSGGTSTKVSGQNVMNSGGAPADFIVLCPSTVTSFQFSGNAGFAGVFVAPNADMSLGGGGNNTSVDFCGAIMANSVSMGGHFNFHYDESLANDKDKGKFIITAWNEIK